MSVASTSGSVMPFEPFDITPKNDQDLQKYPSPSLYDIVLELNSEASMDAWWSTTTEVMRNWYKVERATLAMPADATDIENIPWGQKAAFDIAGIKDLAPIDPSTQRSVSSESGNSRTGSSYKSITNPDSPRSKLHSQRHSRPSIFNHHSVAGYEMGGITEKTMTPKDASTNVRPQVARRTTSNIQTLRRSSPTRPVISIPDSKMQRYPYQGSSSASTDRDLDTDADLCLLVYSTLRSLDHEAAALLDSSGVNRVLEKGKAVALTREWLDISHDVVINSATTGPPQDDRQGKAPRRSRNWAEGSLSRIGQWRSPKPSAVKHLGQYNYIVDQPQEAASYEEYEQVPCSPWSQSPAPSPAAIQEDPNINPFFMSGNLDEGSFSPTPTKEDYSRYGSVPLTSIGIDASSRTIIHIPLIHPIQNAPIAILSILSPVVPYPQSLIESLRHLGPHLATSCHTSLQHSNVQNQMTGVLNRRGLPRLSTGGVHMLTEELGSGLFDIIDNASSTGSLSDYSGRSRHSPGGSLIGTPSLEASKIGGTPGPISGVENMDNYFDVRKKMALNRSHSGGEVSQRQLAHSSALAEGKQDDSVSRKEQRVKKVRVTDPFNTPKDTHRPHSLLHSYGADFSSSFQSLPAPAVPRGQGVNTLHSRKLSSGDVCDMPPPSERLLRTIIDSLPVQIFTAAPSTGAVTWVNSKFLVYRGHTARQVLLNPWQSIHSEDLKDYMTAWNQSLQTGQQFSQRVRLRRFDGHVRYFMVRAVPLRNAQAQLVHWIGTYMDCHEETLHQANAARQQETAKSEAKYRALANSSPQIVFAATKSKGLTFCNSQWLSYSGQNEEQALGVGFLEAVHHDDLAKCKLPIFDKEGNSPTNVPISVLSPLPRTRSSAESSEDSADSVETVKSSSPANMAQRHLSELASTGISSVSKDAAGKPSYSTEVRLRMKNSQYRWHLVRLVVAEAVTEDETNEETWYGTATEIEAHKRLEQELKETMDAKTRFLSNMSHEIRTPLNGIHGMASFLIDSALTPEQMDQVNVIEKSADGLKNLINDILDFSKVEAGMIELTMDWLHVRSIIEEVNDLTASIASQKGLELNYLVDENVPHRVKGDKFRLRQVLLNVIGNAIKFTQEGEVLVACKVFQDEQPGAFSLKHDFMLQFDISDTGLGFNDEEAELLFKRFSQIDASSTRQHGGSGLGLVISKNLVELHGGSMTATSIPSQGSMFSFTIACPEVDQVVASTKPLLDQSARISNSKITGQEVTQSPAPYSPSENLGLVSPPLSSSVSSNPSIRSTYTVPSQRSSASSYGPEPVSLTNQPNATHKTEATTITKSALTSHPLLYSILVVSPLRWSRLSTVIHVENSLPLNTAHHVSQVESLAECQQMIGGNESIVFTHIVVVLRDSGALVELIEQSRSSTSIVVICDLKQKRDMFTDYPKVDFASLKLKRRVQFVFKPLKPSKLAAIFDPQKSRAMSADPHHDSVQQIKDNQSLLFDDTARRLGNRGFRVLLVEDNKINQQVCYFSTFFVTQSACTLSFQTTWLESVR